MTPMSNEATTLERFAGVPLAVGMLAGPVGTHVYWMPGGTWGGFHWPHRALASH